MSCVVLAAADVKPNEVNGSWSVFPLILWVMHQVRRLAEPFTSKEAQCKPEAGEQEQLTGVWRGRLERERES